MIKGNIKAYLAIGHLLPDIALLSIVSGIIVQVSAIKYKAFLGRKPQFSEWSISCLSNYYDEYIPIPISLYFWYDKYEN